VPDGILCGRRASDRSPTAVRCWIDRARPRSSQSAPVPDCFSSTKVTCAGLRLDPRQRFLARWIEAERRSPSRSRLRSGADDPSRLARRPSDAFGISTRSLRTAQRGGRCTLICALEPAGIHRNWSEPTVTTVLSRTPPEDRRDSGMRYEIRHFRTRILGRGTLMAGPRSIWGGARLVVEPQIRCRRLVLADSRSG